MYNKQTGQVDGEFVRKGKPITAKLWVLNYRAGTEAWALTVGLKRVEFALKDTEGKIKISDADSLRRKMQEVLAGYSGKDKKSFVDSCVAFIFREAISK